MAIRVSNYRIQISASARGLSGIFNSAVGLAQNFSRRVQGALNFGLTNFFNIRTFASDIASAFGELTGLADLDGIVELDQVSRRLGVVPEEIQAISAATKRLNLDFDATADFITEVTKRAAEAQADGGAIGDAFSRLGIDPAQFRLQTPLNQLKQLEESLADFARADQLFLLDEIAGDVGVRVANIFDGQAIANAERFGEAIGGFLNAREVASITQANAAIGTLGDTIDIAQQKILSGVAPALTVASQIAQEFVANFRIDPQQVTEGIIQGIAFVEGFVFSLGTAKEAIEEIGGAWDFVSGLFQRVQQGILTGLGAISNQIAVLLGGLSIAAEFAGLDDLTQSLERQALDVNSFTESFRASAEDIQNSIEGIQPEITEGSIADRIRAQLESLQAIDLEPPPVNLTAAGEQFKELEDLGTKAGENIKKALDLRSLTANSAETIDLLNNRNLALRVDGSAEATTKIEVKNDRQNFRPLERKTDSSNRLLSDIATGIRDLRTDTEDDADDVIVEVELVC